MCLAARRRKPLSSRCRSRSQRARWTSARSRSGATCATLHSMLTLSFQVGSDSADKRIIIISRKRTSVADRAHFRVAWGRGLRDLELGRSRPKLPGESYYYYYYYHYYYYD